MSDKSQMSVQVGRSLQVSADRQSIRDALSVLVKPGSNQEWCVACGAGKGIDLPDKGEWVQNAGSQVLQGKNLKEFVESLKDFGEQAWCVACGAGKDANPLDRLGDPQAISDQTIDTLASKLIGALKVG